MSTPSVSVDEQVAELRRQIRLLKTYGALAALALAVLGLATARWLSSRAELTLERINIVDASGTPRLVIANAAQFPLPRLHGKQYPRAVHPAGLVFYDAKGDELGGLAITDAAHGRSSALAFDYPNYDAIGLITRVGADGKSGVAGLHINSRPPGELDVLAAAKVVQRRVAIHNDNENAEILLADAQGHDRIVLRVDADGNATMEIRDRDGKVTFSAP